MGTGRSGTGRLRSASVGRVTTAASIAKNRKKQGYKVLKHTVTVKKKKLDIMDTYIETPPVAYSYLSVGYPDIASLCKELTRQEGRRMRIVYVSNDPKN